MLGVLSLRWRVDEWLWNFFCQAVCSLRRKHNTQCWRANLKGILATFIKVIMAADGILQQTMELKSIRGASERND